MRGYFLKQMSSTHKNLSKFEGSEVPSAARYKFGIVWAEWNHEITHELKEGALSFLRGKDAKERNITIRTVPGAYELTLGAQYLLEKQKVDAVIVLGCVIQGETRHFDFICDAVANGITELNIKYKKLRPWRVNGVARNSGCVLIAAMPPRSDWTESRN